MLEAKFPTGGLLKKLVEGIKDLVNEANFDCSPGGISIQAMDQSHVALVNLLLNGSGFDGDSGYQCERNTIIGLNLGSLSKVLKITDTNDTLILTHEDDSDLITIATEASDKSKRCSYQLKLMEIEAEALGIPEMEYVSWVSFGSADFAKVCKDMSVFGDTVTVQVDKTGILFTASGDIGDGSAFLPACSASDVKSEVKPEAVKSEVKTEQKGDDEDDDEVLTKKFESKKVKTEGGDKDKSAIPSVEVHLEEPVTLSFALRYFNTFSKGYTLSDRVTLHFAKDSPCMIEYKLEEVGYLRYYLAPKVDESE